MPNDEKKDLKPIIEEDENGDEVIIIEEEEEEGKKDGEEGDEGEGEDPKPVIVESPADRKARLDRMQKQHMKKHPELYGNPAPTKAPKATVSEDLPQTDLIALIKADVHDEDISEVADYAKMKGISVREALQSNFVKTLLSDNAEMRKTANATHVGSTRKGPTKVTEQTLLDKANKGEMPDSEEDIRRMHLARKGISS